MSLLVWTQSYRHRLCRNCNDAQTWDGTRSCLMCEWWVGLQEPSCYPRRSYWPVSFLQMCGRDLDRLIFHRVGRGPGSGVRGPGSGNQISVGARLSAWGVPSLLNSGYWVLLGNKAAGAWRWPPTLSTAEVKERIELYLYYPSGSLWPVLGQTVPVLYP